MTVKDIFLLYNSLVDKLSSNTYAEISALERDRIFNLAIEKFIKERYGINNLKREGFEVTQKRTDDLSNLSEVIIIDPLTSISEKFSETVNCTFFRIPLDYWFMLYHRAKILIDPCPKYKNINDCGVIKRVQKEKEESYCKIDTRRQNEINSVLLDPFNKPQGKEMFSVIVDGDTRLKDSSKNNNLIKVFHDSNVEIINLELGYLKEFKKLKIGETYEVKDKSSPLYYGNLEFWFNDQSHQEITQIAATLTESILESPRYQASLNELQKIE